MSGFDLFGQIEGQLEEVGGVEVVKKGCVTQAEELLIAPLIDRYSKIQNQEAGPDLLTVFKINCALAAILMRRTLPSMVEGERAERAKCCEKSMGGVPKGTVEALADFLLNERSEWEESELAEGGELTGQPTSPSSKSSTASPTTDSQPDSQATDAGKVQKPSSTATKAKSSSRSKNASE